MGEEVEEAARDLLQEKGGEGEGKEEGGEMVKT